MKSVSCCSIKMPLFRRFTLQIAIILYIHQCEAFMFKSIWVRSSTEKNPPTTVYTLQNYRNDNTLQKSQIQRLENGVKEPSKLTSEKDEIRGYQNSIASKQKLPFNAVVVPSLPTFIQPLQSPNIGFVAIPAPNYPYLYYRDEPKTETPLSYFTTTLIPQKSVQVEVNYQDDKGVEKLNENVQQQKKLENSTETNTTTQLTLDTKNIIQDDITKANLPTQPIKLVGLGPVYNIPNYPKENFTFTPQIVLEPVAPVPVIKGLPFGPPGFFRNVHRSVSERSELPNVNAVPVSSIVPQPENKQPSPTSGPLCPDCFLPPKFLSYPTFKLSTNDDQKPCQHENHQYKNNIAYVVFAPPQIKNNS